MRFSCIRLQIWKTSCLLVIAILAFNCKSFATDVGSISDAFINGIDHTLSVANQAYNEAQSLTAKAAEEERQRLAELGYPEGYDPNDPVGMGIVDPWEAYEEMQSEEMDKAMAEEAMRAWEDYNMPDEPDISDGIIKP